MATISDPFLFRWDSVDQLGDLERLQLVLDALPDEPLMQLLEADRGHGRNDYPVRPMWNSLIAAFVFQHPSIAALRRELLRNGQLRDSCGFDPFAGAAAVPTECAYTRFQRRLRKYQPQIEELFHSTLDELQIELPDLGPVQALDGKELHSLAKGESSYPLPEDDTQQDTDGRRDRDADWGVKGSGKKKRYWYGYLLHLVVDASYELPLAFEVTEASRGEQPQAQWLLDQMQQRHPELLDRCSRLSADKGYDDHKLINRLWDQHQIKPIIAIRNCWKDADAEDDGVRTKLVNGQENVIYTYDGEVSCVCPLSGEVHSMDLRRLRARSRDAEVPLSGALLGDHLPGHGAVSAGGQSGAHPAGGGSPGVHAGGAVQLCVAGLLRRAQRSRASQTVAWRAASGSSDRASAGWRRCSCASPWR